MIFCYLLGNYYLLEKVLLHDILHYVLGVCFFAYFVTLCQLHRLCNVRFWIMIQDEYEIIQSRLLKCTVQSFAWSI
jgi:hypothetical protein